VADAGRVIAGRARGRRLAPAGPGSRPLADRVKEALFGILEPELPGAAVLDLFAGSGAGGIEALSRGARTAVFVDRDRAAIQAIEANLRSTGLAGPEAVVRRAEVLAYLRERARSDGPFDVALLDPPYDESALLGSALERLGDDEAGILAAGARVVAKHFWRDRPRAVVGLLASDRERRFGETALTFYRAAASGRAGGPPIEEG